MANKHNRTISDLLANGGSPIDLSVIPNTLGINLSSVKALEWTEQEGQLVDLTFRFNPDLPPVAVSTTNKQRA